METQTKGWYKNLSHLSCDSRYEDWIMIFNYMCNVQCTCFTDAGNMCLYLFMICNFI